MVIQCKNLISLYILPDQRRVNLSAFFDYIRGQKASLKIQIPIERKVKEASKISKSVLSCKIFQGIGEGQDS